jgi:hypothetical protein
MSKKAIISAIFSGALLLFLFASSTQAQVWENLPGHAKDIAAGGDSTDVVWAIGRDDSAFLWNENSFTWQTFGGKAQIIAVTTDGIPWVVNNGQIYRLRGQVWQNMPGQASAIASGGGEVWKLDRNGVAFKWNDDAWSWQSFGGRGQTIAVDSNGTPWVVQNMQVYRLRGQAWQNMPGKVRSIAAGGGQVWAVGESFNVFHWNEDAYTWRNVAGNARVIAVGGTGTPYVLQQNGTQVHRLRGWRN